MCRVIAAPSWFECVYETIVVSNLHSLMMGHSDLKPVEVDMLKHFCNSDEVYACVGLFLI
jgi:hypothetical protein